MNIVHVVRRRDPRFFSIELVFEHVRSAWPDCPAPTVWELPRAGVSLWNLLFLLRRAWRAPRDTVYHVTGDALYAVFALPRGRTTLTMHDCVFLHRRKGLRRWLLLKLTLEWPIRWCTVVTAVSEKTRQEVVAATGHDRGRIQVIPNPVPPGMVHVEKPFDEAFPKILFVGVTPNKNLSRTLEALMGLDVHLSIVGEPGEELRRKLLESAISHDISHGLTQEEIVRKYAVSDMVIFPSLYEGFGLPILEGFRSGRPVVTSRLQPMEEVAGGAACLVDPFDSQDIRRGVLLVCRDGTYRQELVSKGLERVRAFEPSRIAEAYLALYGRLSLGRTHPETAP